VSPNFLLRIFLSKTSSFIYIKLAVGKILYFTRAYGAVEVQGHSFLTQAPDMDEGSKEL
jgi:hypothetical protein